MRAASQIQPGRGGLVHVGVRGRDAAGSAGPLPPVSPARARARKHASKRVDTATAARALCVPAYGETRTRGRTFLRIHTRVSSWRCNASAPTCCSVKVCACVCLLARIRGGGAAASGTASPAGSPPASAPWRRRCWRSPPRPSSCPRRAAAAAALSYPC